MKRIVLVEDNPDWLERCQTELKREFPKHRVNVIETEYRFRESISDFEAQPPQVFIIDVMLPWTEPEPNIPEPEQEVKDDGFFKAGLRCHRLLARNERLRNVPILFWTILSEADLQRELRTSYWEASYVAKDADLRPLINKIRELIRG